MKYIILMAALSVGCMKISDSNHRMDVGGEATITPDVQINLDSILDLCKKADDTGKCITDVVSALAVNDIALEE
jgi:hypothetical protein